MLKIETTLPLQLNPADTSLPQAKKFLQAFLYKKAVTIWLCVTIEGVTIWRLYSIYFNNLRSSPKS